MSKLQKILLLLTVIACIVLIWVFWGSIFSIILACGLIAIPAIYLSNRFLYSDEKPDIVDEL